MSEPTSGEDWTTAFAAKLAAQRRQFADDLRDIGRLFPLTDDGRAILQRLALRLADDSQPWPIPADERWWEGGQP